MTATTTPTDATERAHPPLAHYDRPGTAARARLAAIAAEPDETVHDYRARLAGTAAGPVGPPTFDGQPITAPVAAAYAADALREARTHVDHVDTIGVGAAAQVATLVTVADGWRQLAIALAQHLPMTPRPAEDRR